ncbi:MAG: DUF5615 family PIN-like protein [Acidimicrobiia bacterium]
MKLLLDANISRQLIPRISGTFPDSSHVALLGLGDATDDEIWLSCRSRGSCDGSCGEFGSVAAY